MFMLEQVVVRPGDLDICGGLFEVVVLLVNVVNLLKWLIPIGLVLFGMLDLGKAVIAGKEDEMKKATGTLVKRVIYAIAIFLVVTIVTFVTGIVGSDGWKTCWTDAQDGVQNTATGTNGCIDADNNGECDE